MNEIDFVIFWVDGSDPAWLAEWRKAKAAESEDDDASSIRIRYWHNLHYWFRGIERFAPWVRRIHLVTWGHLPEWLRRDHPRLHIVNHRDFIPAEYLPTFNSLTIGMNLHRIEGLAEQFVVFNDDMFLTRDCRPKDFFRRGLPCDMARLSVVQPSSIGHILYNDLELINAKYSKNAVIRTHPGKWFSLKYGITNLLKTMTLIPWSMFTGILDHHVPQPSLRSHWEACWCEWYAALDKTCRHTFRNLTNVSDYLFRYDMLASGAFAPRSMADCRLMTLTDDSLESICRDIERQRWRMICLNDSEHISDFDRRCQRLCDAFKRILPEKSSYEI
ncbi:stealth family protein [Alistipes putredinis]|uniref:stealth family protein n=1 Tax=Alistipes putredinis TaxID=28117 RepID=UPI0024AE7522|nr:stealth family protein [Alistipes putredinis]